MKGADFEQLYKLASASGVQNFEIKQEARKVFEKLAIKHKRLFFEFLFSK